MNPRPGPEDIKRLRREAAHRPGRSGFEIILRVAIAMVVLAVIATFVTLLVVEALQ